MNHVIETVGRWGVKTTPLCIRIDRPHAGDLVDFPEELRAWPVSVKTCRIVSIDKESGMAHLVRGMGSAFLHDDGSLTVSGGPFFSVPVDSLKPTCELRTSIFWNWGDNGPGADQGVEYEIRRPVFRATTAPA